MCSEDSGANAEKRYTIDSHIRSLVLVQANGVLSETVGHNSAQHLDTLGFCRALSFERRCGDTGLCSSSRYV